ncbi:DUF2920 family protein, partial [Campylobacter jejuni]|nr:DUF2920 family protein [Campylobacter jejuni]
MLINQTFEIDSCDDVELGIKRTSKLEYRISYDDEKDIKAIVFVISGMGANKNISFLDFDREYIAKKFDVVAVSVFYHCFSMRFSEDIKYSAIKVFTSEDLEKLEEALSRVGINSSSLTTENSLEYATLLEQRITQLKENGQIPLDYRATISSTFIPPNGEYQNYALMPAIDHINALKDLVKRFPKFADLPKIYGGGSYGGVIGLMCAKIAPWYVDGVIDNSLAVLPPLKRLVGREIGECEYVEGSKNLIIEFFLKSYWTRKDITSPYYLYNENYIIRSFLNKDHLILQHNINPNIIYISYHSKHDTFTPADYKIQLHEFYKFLKLDATLYLIKDESEIDGRFIKDLNHGMRISDKALFRKELPLMLEKLQGRKSFMQENSISYPCGNKVFIFKDVEN